VALCLVGWAGAEASVQVKGPICDDANTVVICDGSSEPLGSLEIGNGTCGVWSMRGMLVGSFYWSVISQYSSCASTPQTPSNYTYVNGANGFRFYQYHHNHNASSYSRTCDRCALGLVGATGNVYIPHVHAVHTQNGTKLTSWYTGYVTCGSKAGCSYTLGYLRMS
jgi:hypothetical protein